MLRAGIDGGKCQRPGWHASRVLLVTDRRLNVLFLCTGNSARSIIAESLLNAIAGDRFQAFSAGSHPSGTVNPLVIDYLCERGIDTARARSKSWDEFAAPGAAQMDLVVTVCDQAAGEVCPVWPGHPARAHWSAPDPAAYMSDANKAREVVAEVFELMRRRIAELAGLGVDQPERASLEAAARRIGEREADPTHAHSNA
jgi:arsenate reductase